jgi:hypothetical protein
MCLNHQFDSTRPFSHGCFMDSRIAATMSATNCPPNRTKASVGFTTRRSLLHTSPISFSKTGSWFLVPFRFCLPFALILAWTFIIQHSLYTLEPETRISLRNSNGLYSESHFSCCIYPFWWRSAPRPAHTRGAPRYVLWDYPPTCPIQ